jgi:hypothetical protein
MTSKATFSSNRDVEATTQYVVKDGIKRSYGQAAADERRVVFHNMRRIADQPTLKAEGFQLARHSSRVTDWEDMDQVGDVYLPEVRDLIHRLTGAKTILMQPNWVIRSEDREMASRGTKFGKHVTTMKTAGEVHQDYDSDSAHHLAQHSMLAAGISERPKGRLLGINTWRSITAPPQDRPLALIDRRTVSPSDYVPGEIVAPTMTFTALQSAYNPGHRFCWWSNMGTDEILVFLQYEEGVGPVSGVLHTAFSDPACPPEAPTRGSIEARAYAFVEE